MHSSDQKTVVWAHQLCCSVWNFGYVIPTFMSFSSLSRKQGGFFWPSSGYQSQMSFSSQQSLTNLRILDGPSKCFGWISWIGWKIDREGKIQVASPIFLNIFQVSCRRLFCCHGLARALDPISYLGYSPLWIIFPISRSDTIQTLRKFTENERLWLLRIGRWIPNQMSAV